nr:hypothetical protein [Treponema sp.]
MKKHILTLVLAIFCTAAVFTETKIDVKQHIISMDADQAMLDTVVIDSQEVLEQGGKVILRYDFEITDKGFFDANNLYIFLRFPSEYHCFDDETVLKVTAFSGATDLRCDVQNAFIGDSSYYLAIGKLLGRLPKAELWTLRQRRKEKDTKEYKYDFREKCIAIPLKMVNKKGNKASIEFVIDFNQIADNYYYCLEAYKNNKEFISWYENLLSEIPIDITFHTKYDSMISYSISRDTLEKSKYAEFVMNVDYYHDWLHDCEASNHMFTIMVK